MKYYLKPIFKNSVKMIHIIYRFFNYIKIGKHFPFEGCNNLEGLYRSVRSTYRILKQSGTTKILRSHFNKLDNGKPEEKSAYDTYRSHDPVAPASPGGFSLHPRGRTRSRHRDRSGHHVFMVSLLFVTVINWSCPAFCIHVIWINF